MNANQRPMILWAWILRITYESWMLEGLPPPIYNGIPKPRNPRLFDAVEGRSTTVDLSNLKAGDLIPNLGFKRHF